ncbi:hypothetical protein BK187_03750 [Brucella melitensis]|uniref:Uncharacterized protein n=1 Tax=Brucella suis TaxID=29461 RepID=A0AAI8E7P1_BRUSS|nr:hypothetical protein BK187_03750 [Brucella melitensis]ASU72015.1 hypothetical protein CJP69_07345 [Brucella abortus]ATN19845.1 hypothetical protein CRN66_08260 [Brucella canis]ATQ51781.1 hypothetical protein CS875_03515 [Brucella suis]ARY27496.1 hypothetical protein BK219_03750 [Brucella melitensis]
MSHYPTHRSGIRNQSSGLISPRRRFALLARKCFSGSCLKESSEPLYLFIFRIVPRKTASHFCWKCL